MKRRRIFWQLVPAYLILILLSVAGVSLYAFHTMENFFLQQTRINLETQARLLEKQVLHLMTSADFEAIDQYCKAAAQTQNTRISVILANGQVVGDSKEDPLKMENHRSRPEISAAYQGKTASVVRFSGTLNQRMMYVAVPLIINEHAAGVLRTSLAVTAIDEQFDAVGFRILIISFFIAFLASALCLYFSHHFSRPVEEMKNGAVRFAKGELDHRLPEPGTMELSELASTMNLMAGQLKIRMDTVIDQRKELESVLDSMIEGVIALDLDDAILRMNPAAANFFETTPEVMIGKSIQEAVRNQRLSELIAQCTSTLQTAVDDICIHNEDGKIINACCAPLRNAQGNSVGTLVVFNDVTQLRQLENMRRDFAANVSHEIKTPLTAIKGFVETLLQESASQESGDQDQANEEIREDQSHKFLTIIARHVDRLTTVIDDIMYLSRIERGSEITPQKLEKISIRTVLNTAIQLCKEKAQEKKISIEITGDAASAWIDATLIEQAAVNLLDNAIKYSFKNSTITIETLLKGDEIEIRFQDQGIGIAAKHLPRLFERFYRVDKARSRKMGGTGLGLAIVKHIAQAHGGHISVNSKVGEGSIFTLHLPLKKPVEKKSGARI